MGHLKRILDRRPPIVNQLRPDATVWEAVELMVERQVGIVAIVENDRLVGVFSERDLLTRVVHRGKDPKATRLADVMTKDPVTSTPDELRHEALKKMQEHPCRHLPILAGGRFVDMLSMRDLLQDALEDSKKDLTEIRKYIQEGG